MNDTFVLCLIFFDELVEECVKLGLDFNPRVVNMCFWSKVQLRVNNDLISSKLINNFIECFEEPDFVFFGLEGGWITLLYCVWYPSISLLKNVWSLILTFEASFLDLAFGLHHLFENVSCWKKRTLVCREVRDFNLESLNLTYLIQKVCSSI